MDPWRTRGSSYAAAAGILASQLVANTGVAQSPLTADLRPDGSVELKWTEGGSTLAVEQTPKLVPGAIWLPLAATIQSVGNSRTIVLSPNSSSAFYRLLPAVPLLTHIESSSPAPGETGVAVTRETVFRFNFPLAEEPLLDSAHLHAEAAGRRILSRAEIASDRRTATLFYLENLPASARVTVTFAGNGIKGAGNLDLDADGDGQPGGIRILEFSTSGNSALPGTGVIGHVYATELGATGTNRPLANVTITVDGAEETLRTRTDTNGFFRLSPAPAGRFFVHVDGRTATGSQWPSGAYYPFVGKAWEAVAGRTNNLAGGNGLIFLPKVSGDTLVPVSAVEDTRIGFAASLVATNPAFAGVEIQVPGGSLFSDNGNRGGRVGMAPVAADRLPEPLPPGLNLPLVITVQTDGAMNFDRPVPARFPNLPDPQTGEKLPPGAKTVLWSFNHDTGRWEAQGTMTISTDGNFAVTDPGVGIRQPGWHGAAPGSTGSGPRNPPGSSSSGGGDPENCPPGSDCECTEKITCTFPKAGKSVGHCILECLGNTIEYLTGDGERPKLSPIEAGIQCIGGPDLCPGNVVDVLNREKRDCMDACQHPDPDVKSFTVPCEGSFSPCPTGGGDGRALPAAFESLLPDRLEEQKAFWETEGKYYEALTGTPKILQLDEEGSLKMEKFFAEFASRVRTGTPSGIHLSAQERIDLIALPRPGVFTSAEWAAMIDRLDSFQGAELPANVALARQRVQELVTLLKSRGWKSRIDGIIHGHARATWKRAPKVGSASFPGRAHFYRLKNHSRGFVQRGRLNSDGLFENIILAPESVYSVAYYDPVTRGVGAGLFESRRVGAVTPIPTAPLEVHPDAEADADGDGLTDLAELIVGTNPSKVDSDGDGVSDATELAADTNPLDGQPATIGVVGGLSLPGNAISIGVHNNLAVVGLGNSRVAFVDIRVPTTPVLLSALDVPAVPTGIAFTGNNAVLAFGTDFAQPIQLFDLSDRENPKFLREIHGIGRSVATTRGYICFDNGASVGILAPGELDATSKLIPEAVNELQAKDGMLYVLTATHLRIYAIESSTLVDRGSVAVPGGTAPLEFGRKLFIGDGYAYVGTFIGWRAVDVRNPDAPVLTGISATTQAAIHDLVTDGNRLIGTTSFGGTSSLAASVYDARNPAVTTNLLASFPTPGDARAVAISRGIGLVTDTQAGLTVINFLAPDQGTNPPTITLHSTFSVASPPTQESDALFQVAARTTDDVMVREVEFYVDDRWVHSDTTFPFEADLRAPLMSDGRNSFVVSARAIDTGGNATWSERITARLARDLTPPGILSIVPELGVLLQFGAPVTVQVHFSEPLDPATLGGFGLIQTGADESPGTGDDVVIPSTISLTGTNEYTLTFSQPLPVGEYAARLGTSLSDRSGNRLKSERFHTFRIRPLFQFTGQSNVVWSHDPRFAVNWSVGRIPTSRDLVEVAWPGPDPVQIQGLAEAGRVVIKSPVVLNNGALNLLNSAVFESGVTFGSFQFRTGAVTFRGTTQVTNGTLGVFAQNWWNEGNFKILPAGRIDFRSPVGSVSQIRNTPSGVWEMDATSMGVGSSSGGVVDFYNEGRLISHNGPNRLHFTRFHNPGVVEVRSGLLQINAGPPSIGPSMHLGTYRVDAGGTLSFERGSLVGNGLHEFGRLSRIHGAGNVNLVDAFIPGNFEVDGTNTITGNTVFAGPVRSAGIWKIMRQGGQATFRGLNPELTGRLEVNGVLVVNVPPQMNVSSLHVIDGNLNVATAIEVRDSLQLISNPGFNAVLSGPGRVRANGTLRFSGIVNSGGPGILEIACPATAAPGSIVQFQNSGYALVVHSNGVLNLNGITRAIVRGGITNRGVVVKSDAGETELSRDFHNAGSFRANGGTALVLNGAYIQSQGTTTLAGGTIAVRRGSGVSTDTTFRLLGGELNGAGILTCGSATNAAKISPGTTASPTGIIDLQVGNHPTLSNYRQMIQGILSIQLRGTLPGTGHDQLKVSGRSQLSGILQLSVLPEHDPSVGQEYVILTAAKVEGEFASVQIDRVPPGKALKVVYEANRVKVVVVASP